MIYALRRGDGPIFYVGRTGNPEYRLYVHQRRLGKDVRMTVLQERLCPGETPVGAEFKWIDEIKKTVQLTNKITRPAEARDEWFTFQMPKEWKARLEGIANAERMSQSTWLRTTVIAAMHRYEARQKAIQRNTK